MLKKYRVIIIYILVLGLIILSGFVFGLAHRSSATHRVQMDGPSMESAIPQGSVVLVEKYKTDQTPTYNDIVEYVNPTNTKQNLIHRVVGLPGDRVTINDDQLLVYNPAHPNGYNPDPYAKLYVSTQTTDETLSSNMYFVLGDNAVHAMDSRFVGPVPLSSILGKVRE